MTAPDPPRCEHPGCTAEPTGVLVGVYHEHPPRRYCEDHRPSECDESPEMEAARREAADLAARWIGHTYGHLTGPRGRAFAELRAELLRRAEPEGQGADDTSSHGADS